MHLDDLVYAAPNGDCFTVVGDWRSEYRDYIVKRNISRLDVNYAHGFTGENLDFLADLDFLESLDLLLYHVHDISPVECLGNLRYLALNRTGSKGLNFSAFSNLKFLSLNWRSKSESLFSCQTLEELRITGLPGPLFTRVSELKKLNKLEITSGTTSSLSGIEQLVGLANLGLYYMPKLTSLDGIQSLSSLEVLDIETCKKIGRLDQVAGLAQLKELSFANCAEIASIRPIADLKKLETIRFWESTDVLDGDLSPLTELPNLKDVRFKNRRHYSLRCEQFPPFGDNPEYPKKQMQST